MRGDPGVLADGGSILAGREDWAQICVYSGGRAMEMDLSTSQMSALALVLGLYVDADGLGSAVEDELIESEVIPLLMREIPEIWRREMRR